MIDFENCNYITSVEYIGSMGKTIPPMLLVSRVNILYKQYQYNDLGSNIIINIIETGYVNDDTVLEWLQHFIDHKIKSGMYSFFLS